MTLLITQDLVEKHFTMDMAIPVIEDVFRMAGNGGAENAVRYCLPFPDGFMRFGPAILHDSKVAGFKLWANFGSGPSRGWNFLFDLETGDLLAILHSYSLGRFRTSATTAVAAKYLARPDASTIGLYGTGRLAEAQLKAISAVRPIKSVKAYSRTRESREAFCRDASKNLGLDVQPASRPEDAAADVDIVLSITNSQTPVVYGKWMTRPGLVLAIGANQWHEREVDEEIIKRAKLIVVDDKEQAKVESGDLLWPIAHGLLTWSRVEELGHIVAGRLKVPDLNTETILFVSHGLGTEDVAVSAKMYEIAKEKGLGQDMNLSLGKARSEISSPGVDVPVQR